MDLVAALSKSINFLIAAERVFGNTQQKEPTGKMNLETSACPKPGGGWGHESALIFSGSGGPLADSRNPLCCKRLPVNTENGVTVRWAQHL